MRRILPALLLLAAAALPAAGQDESAAALPAAGQDESAAACSIPLDEALRRDGDRHRTLGPTGKRLFTERIEEAPGIQGVFSYLHATPGFRNPISLGFRDEDGALAAGHVRTVWRPSHLEVRWLLEGRGAGGGIDVIERKFITEDDALVDRVRVVNGSGRPVSIEVVASGGMTPLPERFRSRQIHCDLSPAANVVPFPGRRLFTGRAAQTSVWVEGETPFFQQGSAGTDRKAAASGGGCLGSGFGAEKGHRALYVVVCPEVGDDADADAGGAALCLGIRYARGLEGDALFGIEIDGRPAGTVVFAPTGGWGGNASHWRFARVRPEGLAPGLRRIALVPQRDGCCVNVDGFFVMPASVEPPPLPDAGRYPAGTEEQIAYLPGSVDYDGVRFLLPDPAAGPEDGAAGGSGPGSGGASPSAAPRPTLVALRGGIAGDPALAFPEEAVIAAPGTERAVETVHLLALVAGPRGFAPGAAAAFTFLFDDGSSETVPFPDVTDRIVREDGGRPARAAPPAAGAAWNERAHWRFLALPLIGDPCVQLSYTPPPGRFVRSIRFHRESPATARPDVPVLLAATREIPPPSGRLPAYLGQKDFHGMPVSLALAGTEFAAVRTRDDGRVLVRSLQLEPGAAADFALVLSVDRRDDRAVLAAIEKASQPGLFEQHLGVYGKWFDDFTPRFDCSDPLLEKLWLYRWFLARHCMVRPEAPPLTAPVFYEGMHGGRSPAVTAFSTPHILAETRWLRDTRFAAGQVRAFLRTMDGSGLFGDVRIGGTSGRHGSHWIPAAAVDAYRVNGDRRFLMEVLYLLARNVDGTLAAFDEDGDGLPAPRSRRDTGMERQPSFFFFGGSDSTGPEARLERPDSAACAYASCAALAEGFALLGDREREERYGRLAEKVRAAALGTLFDGGDGFFYAARADDGVLAPCREAAGFYPFAMGLCPPREPYTRALDFLVDPDEFWTPFPPAAWARPGPGGRAANRTWNGPAWPHAQSVAAEAMARALRSSAKTAVTPALFEEFLRRYARLHFEEGDPDRPLIREFHDGETGAGRGCADTFDSAFNDLLIRYMGGIVPGSRDALELFPIVRGLDRFRFRRILYHGRDVEIVWVRPGTKNPYAGRPEGYTVVVDGNIVSTQPSLKRVTVEL